MKKIEFIAQVTNRLTIPIWVQAELAVHFEDREVRVTVRRAARRRSDHQNRYYWGVVLPILSQGLSDTQGHEIDIDLAHEFVKRKFWAETGRVVNGYYVGFTTTTATTAEWEEKMENIRRWAIEFLNINIPEPNED